MQSNKLYHSLILSFDICWVKKYINSQSQQVIIVHLKLYIKVFKIDHVASKCAGQVRSSDQHKFYVGQGFNLYLQTFQPKIELYCNKMLYYCEREEVINYTYIKFKYVSQIIYCKENN